MTTTQNNRWTEQTTVSDILSRMRNSTPVEITPDVVYGETTFVARVNPTLSDEELNARDERIEANERRIAATMYDND